MDVSECPQPWQKPSSEELLSTLRRLRVDIPAWSPGTPRRELLQDREGAARARRAEAAYLARIVSSKLGWMESDEDKEGIWEEASQRLAERCGRMALGEIVRRWPFACQSRPPFELLVREPAITGDSLGLKTWGSSYLLAKQLENIAATALSGLFAPEKQALALKVLELGSGTGLLGMAAAAIWKAHVSLTDVPAIVPNLDFNVGRNRDVIESLGGSVSTGALTWGGSGEDVDEAYADKHQFHVVLVADGIYDDDHPLLLSTAIQEHLMKDARARAVVMTPLRDSITRRLVAGFRSHIERGERPLVCLEEHSLIGRDDWDEDDEVPLECWWGVFGQPI